MLLGISPELISLLDGDLVGSVRLSFVGSKSVGFPLNPEKLPFAKGSNLFRSTGRRSSLSKAAWCVWIPVNPPLPFFGEGSPTKIEKRAPLFEPLYWRT